MAQSRSGSKNVIVPTRIHLCIYSFFLLLQSDIISRYNFRLHVSKKQDISVDGEHLRNLRESGC